MSKEKQKQDIAEMRKHFIQGVYRTLENVISPTPYLEIKDDQASIDVKLLNGKGHLPKPNTLEVTVLDLDLASMFFDDFHLLYEGVTGVGKTYTSDALFNTVFGPDGHYTLRLSGGPTGNSALEPFTKAFMEDGMPKVRLDLEKLSKYGGLFIDEINRGDSQETFQVIDGKVHVNGESGYLGIPIPGTDKRKGLAIIAAMNPPDAQHSQALELDIAGENRFLKFRFPNGVAEAASSQIEKGRNGDLYKQFWRAFSEKTGLKGGWRESYPTITDPQTMTSSLNGEVREFIDVALGYVNQDPKEALDRNSELMHEGGVRSRLSLTRNNAYDKILEAQKSLKHGFVRRDLTKLYNLSRLLGFVRNVKNGIYEPSFSPNDSAAAIGVILESKTVTGTPEGGLMSLVKEALKEYGELRKEMSVPQGYGLRQAVWQAAVTEGQNSGYEGYVKTIDSVLDKLNTQKANAAQTTIRSRLLADLVVLKSLSESYKSQIEPALKEADPFSAFEGIYKTARLKHSVYEHRLDSVLGGN